VSLEFGTAMFYRPPLNDLNAKFQGKQKLISEIFEAIRTFEMKLK
jgi:hypothetical protein